MIRLSGLQPGHDIEIVFTGMRPGERLNEILFASEEPSIEIGVAGIMAAKPNEPPMQVLRRWLAILEEAIAKDDRAARQGGAKGRLCPNSDRTLPNPIAAAPARVPRHRLEEQDAPVRKVVIVTQHYPRTRARRRRSSWRMQAIPRSSPLPGAVQGHRLGVVRLVDPPTIVEIQELGCPPGHADPTHPPAPILFTLRIFLALLVRLQRSDVVLMVTAPFMLPMPPPWPRG